ncbi:MAG: DUF6076 domain-containing protein [Ruminococcus sp.]|jgi:hypothetical protein|nr:DUF6076 domain-containing protein [Ruminococcus sp.]
MVKQTPIYFTDRINSGNAFFKLDVGRSLLQFSEFDFTFFWETAIEAGRQAKKTGTLPKATMDSARAAISKAHPFIYAGRDGDFSDIVIDCIIEYICRSERLSEDELWMRCISSKIPYEVALFERISKYKTFRAANQWTVISGLQRYVKDKINFIYEGEQQTSLKCLTLKQYFDLAFSIASNECAVPKTALPAVKVYNPCLAPSAAFAVSSSAAKSIYKRLEEQLTYVPDLSDNDVYNTDVLEDKFAVLSYSYMLGMTRPQEPEEELFTKSVENLPEKVYIVSSLKALIDLEFDVMSEMGIHLKKCENCERYFLINATEFGENYCDRINSSGQTCRALAARAAKLALPPETGIDYPPDELDEPENVPFVTNTPQPESPPPIVDREEYFPETGEFVHIKYSAPKREYLPLDIPESVEKRCQALYNSIYKRVAKSINENEFREWSQYLSNMKRNVKTGEGNLEQLSMFLDYSEKLADEIKLAARQKRIIPREPVDRLARFALATDNMHSIGNVPFPDYGITPPPAPNDKDYSSYFAEDNTPAFPNYVPPPHTEARGERTEDRHAEVIHDLPKDAVQSFNPDNFGNSEVKAAGNVKLKDAEPVEIDGRKATLANPVWERVEREE